MPSHSRRPWRRCASSSSARAALLPRACGPLGILPRLFGPRPSRPAASCVLAHHPPRTALGGPEPIVQSTRADGKHWRAQTIAVAAGRDQSPGAPLNVPPTFAATYRDGGEIGYGRFDNPTWSAFERTIGALEGGHGVSFSSGQAASTALLTPLASGATVVLPQDAYTGTRALMSELEQRGGLSLRPVDVTDTEAVLAALDGARVLWLESPTNPMLGIAELPRLLDATKAARVFSVVDNTFATPVLQQPLALGADAVLHWRRSTSAATRIS